MLEVDVLGIRVRAAIAAGLAMAMGCGPNVEAPDKGEGTSSTDDSSGSGSSGGNEPSSASMTSATSQGGETTGDTADTNDTEDTNDTMEIRIDIGGPTVPPPLECLFDPPGCDVALPPGLALIRVCLQDPGCVDSRRADLLNLTHDCLECGGFPVEFVCQSEVGADSCCYYVTYEPGQSCPGRPFTVEGCARLPPTVRGTDWANEQRVDSVGLTVQTRALLARAWELEGAFEAASVASFSRFVLELLSLGAPVVLVGAAQRAVAEEIEHAQTCYGLAQAYGQHRVGPGRLRIEGALLESSSPVEIAERLAAEGCVAETISALQLQVAAARVQDPTLRATLERVAEQELQHAELAWQALAWMLRQGDDELRSRVAQVFADPGAHVPNRATASDVLSPKLLAEHGRLSAPERMELAQRALTTLVADAAADVLSPWTTLAESVQLSDTLHSTL